MICIIYGEDNYLIKNKLDEIISKNKDLVTTKIDFNDKDYTVNDIVNSCTSIGLFNEKSLVLVKDPFFLINKIEDKEIASLIEYCKKPIYETDLVFYTFDNLFNDRLKTFKEISKNADVIKASHMQKKDFNIFARGEIISSNLNITKEAQELLINSSNYDAGLLKQNIEILTLYPEKIDIEVLNRLISFPNEENVFNLINALISKNISLSIKLSNKILETEGSILKLIATLASQLRFLYSVSYYKSQNKRTSEIMNILKVQNPFRIEKAYESLDKMSDKDIEIMLSKLSDLDYDSKINSDIPEKLLFDLFITTLTK